MGPEGEYLNTIKDKKDDKLPTCDKEGSFKTKINNFFFRYKGTFWLR